MVDADLLECDTEWSEYEDGFTAYSRVQIENAPSIDIVFCKECKHWGKWSDEEMFCGCLEGGIGSDSDDFCSYGEREGE